LKIIILSLITGALVGFVFALFKLPIPAPPALPGIMGIVGIYLGYQFYLWIAASFLK
jgi:XapX domain-containing protein